MGSMKFDNGKAPARGEPRVAGLLRALGGKPVEEVDDVLVYELVRK